MEEKGKCREKERASKRDGKVGKRKRRARKDGEKQAREMKQERRVKEEGERRKRKREKEALERMQTEDQEDMEIDSEALVSAFDGELLRMLGEADDPQREGLLREAFAGAKKRRVSTPPKLKKAVA